MSLGERIQRFRKQCGYSQEALAEKLNVSRQTISKWEANQSIPDIERCKQLADIFGISISELAGEEIRKEAAVQVTTMSKKTKVRLAGALGMAFSIILFGFGHLKNEIKEQYQIIQSLSNTLSSMQYELSTLQSNMNNNMTDLENMLAKQDSKIANVDYHIENYNEETKQADLVLSILLKEYTGEASVQTNVILENGDELIFDMTEEQGKFIGRGITYLSDIKHLTIKINYEDHHEIEHLNDINLPIYSLIEDKIKYNTMSWEVADQKFNFEFILIKAETYRTDAIRKQIEEIGLVGIEDPYGIQADFKVIYNREIIHEETIQLNDCLCVPDTIILNDIEEKQTRCIEYQYEKEPKEKDVIELTVELSNGEIYTEKLKYSSYSQQKMRWITVY